MSLHRLTNAIARSAAPVLDCFGEGGPPPGHRSSVLRRQQVLAPERYALEPPRTVQPDCRDVDNDTHLASNPVTLVELEWGRVYSAGPKTLVSLDDGEIVHRGGLDDEECRHRLGERYLVLRGTTVLLADTDGAQCYYHWMVDAMPKLGVVERAGIPLADVDHFLIRKLATGFQRETLARAGVTPERVVESDRYPRLCCERLILVRMVNGINMQMNRFVPAWLRQLIPTTAAAPDATPAERLRLYIGRPKGVRRGISNEDELRPVLERAGFEIRVMEGMTVAEQAALLARADALVSPHGAALTNMVFCRPGIDVVEIYGRHVYPFYYGLAQLCQHRYHAILENAEDYPRVIRLATAREFGADSIQRLTREKHFEVDPERLERMLGTIVGPPATKAA